MLKSLLQSSKYKISRLERRIDITCEAANQEVLTWARKKAGRVHFTDEKLQADNSIDDDDEQDEEGNMKERDHGFNDGVQHHL